MRKEVYSETTIERYVRLLRELSKYGDLKDPESVKVVLSRLNWTEATKEMACGAYGIYAKQHRFTFVPPRYRRVEKLPFIPLESEIDQLIASMGLKTSTFLNILKDTGARPLEAWNLKWTDIDYPSSTVTITPLKHSKPRRLKVSNNTIAQLNQLTRSNLNVFGDGSLRSYQHFLRNFELARKKAAIRLGNPRLMRISFRTLRHFKATMEYQKTRDILHVMSILGHRSIKNTLVYTRLVNFQSDEYVCKVSESIDDATTLVENVFDYVTEMDGMKLFRKRK